MQATHPSVQTSIRTLLFRVLLFLVIAILCAPPVALAKGRGKKPPKDDPPSPPEVMYRFEPMLIPGSLSWRINQVHDNGLLAGYHSDDTGDHALVYDHDGVFNGGVSPAVDASYDPVFLLEDVLASQLPTGWRLTWARGVNSYGDIVGTARNASNIRRSFFVDTSTTAFVDPTAPASANPADWTLHILPDLNSSSTGGAGVNDTGMVLADWQDPVSGASDHYLYNPFAPDNDPVKLGPGFRGGLKLNNQNQVAGFLDTDSHNVFLFSLNDPGDGSDDQLWVSPEDSSKLYRSVSDLNDSGFFSGRVWTRVNGKGPEMNLGYRYSADTELDLLIPEGRNHYFYDAYINEDNDVIVQESGDLDLLVLAGSAPDAPAQQFTLADLLDPSDPLTSDWLTHDFKGPIGLGERDPITGYPRIFGKLPAIGVVLIPFKTSDSATTAAVPEPGTLCLLLLVACAFLFSKRQGRSPKRRRLTRRSDLLSNASVGIVIFLGVNGILPFVTEVPCAYAASFVRLGDLPGGPFRSAPTEVSADGRVVVGLSDVEPWVDSSGHEHPLYEAFRWTAETGMQGLGTLPNFPRSIASGVSADGSVIVGTSDLPDNTHPNAAFRWTEQGGMEAVGPVENPLSPDCVWTGEHGLAISDDGTTIVGSSNDNELPRNGCTDRPFRFTEEEGAIGLGLFGRELSRAHAVSADGSIVAGISRNLFSDPTLPMVWQWHADTGEFTDLGYSASDDGQTFVRDMTPDGSHVIGYGREVGLRHPFLWTQEDGMTPLSVPSYPWGISDDGSVIVGGLLLHEGDEGWIWTESTGARDLAEILTQDLGLSNEIAGWNSMRPLAISGDGRTIAGDGANPDGNREAWVLLLDAPINGGISGDFNGDGAINGGDFLAWQRGESPNPLSASDLAEWEASFRSSAGDFDEDGQVNGEDFLAWQRGESPEPHSTTDLAAWSANYGAASSFASAHVIPEPAAWLLLGSAIANLLVIRTRCARFTCQNL